MEYRTQSQQLRRQNEATQLENERFGGDIGKQMGKAEKAQQSMQSSLNNVRQVKEGFDDSAENVEINGQVEQHKTNHLLSALSVIVNEFPALGTVIRNSFGDDLQIPSRPQSAVDRPVTASSRQSAGQQ